MAFGQSSTTTATTTKPQRRFSLTFPSVKLTGFRRQNQTVPNTQQVEHGKVEMVVQQPSVPSQTLDHPHHYHSYNHRSTPQPQQTQHTSTGMNTRQPRVHFAGSPSPIPSYTQQSQYRNRSNSQSSSSASSSYHSYAANSTSGAGTNSNPVSVASSRSSFEIEPSGPVAEWCHQMHIMQSRKYDWCSACYPRPVQVRDEAYVAAQEEEQDFQGQDQYYQAANRQWAEEDEWVKRERMVRRVRESRGAGHAYQ